jgi:hypothetical protein
MLNSKLGFAAVLTASILAMTTTAQAFCSPQWADVTILCPSPVPYPGTKTLTDTSRNMPTVGTPGTYKNYGWGYDVQVYLSGNGTGYQDFPWRVK